MADAQGLAALASSATGETSSPTTGPPPAPILRTSSSDSLLSVTSLDSTSSAKGKKKALVGLEGIFYVRGEARRAPPCRVTFCSSTSGRWRVVTMGGTLWDGETTYGLIVGRHFLNGSEVSDHQIAKNLVKSSDQGRSGTEEGETVQIVEKGGTVQPTGGGDTLQTTGHGEAAQTPSQKNSKHPSSSSIFIVPEKRLGRIELRDRKNDESRPRHWALVALSTQPSPPMENTIRLPGGFGQEFIVTQCAQRMSEGLVWILTGTGEVIEGLRHTSRRPLGSGDGAISGEWRVRTIVDLSKHLTPT